MVEKVHTITCCCRGFLACVCLFVILGAMSMSVQAKESPQTYSDVDLKSELGVAIVRMAQAGIINGYPDGTFLPNGYLTRAEFVKIANLEFGLLLSDEKLIQFTDVPKEHWAYQQVMVARKAGYIEGVGNNNFAPSATLSREQFCVMVGRIQNYKNSTRSLYSNKRFCICMGSGWGKSGNKLWFVYFACRRKIPCDRAHYSRRSLPSTCPVCEP